MERQKSVLGRAKVVQGIRSSCISGFLTAMNPSLMIAVGQATLGGMEHELFPATCIPLYSGYNVCIVRL